MNLDKVAAVLRHRKGASAIDLGLLLGRRFWLDIMKPWLMLVVPLLIVVQTALAFLIHPAAGIVVGWWLKPLFDRLSLFVISRGFFGSVPGPGESVRAVWKQWKSMETLADLTWRRFSPERTMTMPVRLLEGSSGGAARARISSLYDSSSHISGWSLLILTVCFKWAFYIAAIVLVFMLTPTELFADQLVAWDFMTEQASVGVQIVALVALTTIATTVVEPFFAAAGFGIYVQQRVEREGWDLELRFRRLVERVESSLDGGLGVLLVAGLTALVVGLLGGAAPAQAEEPAEEPVGGLGLIYEESPPAEVDPSTMPVDDAQAEFDAMMEESPFAPRTDTRTIWVPKFDQSDDDPFQLDPATIQLLSAVARVLMWMLFIAAVLYVVWKGWKYIRSRELDIDVEERRQRWRQELMDDDDEFELPTEGVSGAARNAWEQGRHREAMAMLLFKTLITFEERHSFHFPRGWTTSRCAREVNSVQPEGELLANLSRAFSRLAWAGQKLSDQAFVHLVDHFQRVIESTGGRR